MGTKHQRGSLAACPLDQREGAPLPTKASMLAACGSATVLMNLVAEKAITKQIKFKETAHGRKTFRIDPIHIKVIEPVAILYSMESTNGTDVMYNGMDRLGVVLSQSELPDNEQEYMSHIHPGVNHIQHRELAMRMWREMAAFDLGTSELPNRAPFGLDDELNRGYRVPLGCYDEDFWSYLSARQAPGPMDPNGRLCQWVATQTTHGELFVPSDDCWDYVRRYPPAMPSGTQVTGASSEPGRAYYMGIGLGIDMGYSSQTEQHHGGELQYFIVCQEQGSNPGDPTGAMDAWHVEGLRVGMTKDQTLKHIAEAESRERPRSNWESEHGDDHLWAGGHSQQWTEDELNRMYRGIVMSQFQGFGAGTDTTASSITDDDLTSLLFGDDDEDEPWDQVQGAPASSSGDDAVHGDEAPPADEGEDFC